MNPRPHFPAGYGRMARALHWTMAILLTVQWLSGEYDEAFGGRGFHIGLGLIVLVLALIRLGWRIGHPAPPPRSPRRWERIAARVVHGLWYALLLALPASGLLIRQFEGEATPWFGLFAIPAVLPASHALAEAAEEAHEIMATLFLVVLVVHVAAALKHHFIDRDDVLAAMLGRPH